MLQIEQLCHKLINMLNTLSASIDELSKLQFHGFPQLDNIDEGEQLCSDLKNLKTKKKEFNHTKLI